MSWSRRSLLLFIALAPAACGFQPMYRQPDANSGVSQELARISVPSKTERHYQLVRNELVQRLQPDGPAPTQPYRLDIIVTESRGAVLVTRSEDVSRINLSLSVSYKLFDTAGAVLQSGSLTSLASYNVLRAEYFNVAAENGARERAARDAADQLVARLALLFERGQK
jgi:LPS-assembly lipoprotein